MTKSPRTLRLAAWALASLLGFIVTPAQAQKLVFAHYMVTNQDYQGDTDPTGEAKIASYEREIQQAQAAGIDGFALNVGGWLNQTYYIRYSSQMFEAATRLNSGFRLMFSADMCCGNALNDVEDMVRRFANDARYAPVYFKFNGKFVLTTFSGDAMGTGFWNQVKSDLATGSNPSTTTEPTAEAEVSGAPSNAPVSIFLVPAFFWGGEIPNTAAVQQGFSQWRSTIDGSFYWGIAGVPGSGGSLDQIPSSESYASVVHGGGKLYMAPICIQFWGSDADRYFEYSGAAGMRTMWMDAINVSHPDWVEIITWNDFIEGSYVSPIDDPNKYPFANFLNTTGVPSSTLGYFHSHNGATALLPYFIQWYKSGVQPTLSSDSIYWFYRTQSMNQNVGVPTVSASTNFGPVADVIYVTANIAAPATLTVTSGSQVTTFNLQAGSTDVKAPFQVGTTPTFELDRNGAAAIARVSGTDPISASAQFNDYYYSTGSAGGGTVVTSPGSAPPPPAVAPSVPANPAAKGGANEISLSWAASSGTAPVTYNVFRGTSAGTESATPVAKGLNSPSFVDVGLATGTAYYYTVSATNSAGTSSQSAELTAKTLSPFIQIDAGGGAVPPFAADAGFTTSNVFSSSAAIDTSGVVSPAPQAVYHSVRWAPSFTYTMGGLSPGATYLIRLHFAELSFTSTGQRVFNVALNGTSVLSNFDLFAAAGAQNKAVIEEFNTVANSAGQIVIAFTRSTADNPEIAAIQVFGTAGGTASAPVPPTPTGLTASAGNAQVSLSWSASAGATSYSVYRSTTSNGEGMTALATGLTATSFTDSGLASGTPYFYKVAAINGSGASAQSAEVSATALGTPSPGLPDLVVTSFTWSPANPKAGDHVVFTAVVTNQGTAPTPAGVVLGVGFDFDGSAAATVWEDTDTTSLAPGASVNLTTTGGTSGGNYWVATAGTHSVTAWVDDVNRIAESNESNNKLTQAVSSNASTLTAVTRIDAGSAAGAAPFSADTDFNTGNLFSSAATIDTSGAANPAPTAVYQSVRWAPSFSYTIAGLTAGASYTVRLHFAELTWTAAGQRKFNVAINGTSVLTSFDIFAAAGGSNKALTEQFTVTASSAGQIVIAFSQGGADNPEVNGIEVLH